MKMNNRPKSKAPAKTLKRLLSYIIKGYKIKSLFVILFIFISSLANVAGSVFIKKLIDDYITPYANQVDVDFLPLLKAIIIMAMIYFAGVFSTFMYNRIMILITQGTLKRFRDNMFRHMQTLPINYFDTHSHGEIMSLYTNDTDTLRQMISQSIPQLLSSVITIISVFISMIIISLPLTLLAVVMIALMLSVGRRVGGKSAVHFKNQQQALGKINGFIEEMMEGQKVVKVCGMK